MTGTDVEYPAGHQQDKFGESCQKIVKHRLYIIP